MATHWQTYRGGPTKPPDKVVCISINRFCAITLNRQAQAMLNNAEAVKLLFDEKESIIGVLPSNVRDPEAFPLQTKNSTNRVIYATPFCRHFRISVDHTERFVDPELDNEGILRLDLKRTRYVGLRKSRGR
jgi:hypothetical protein